MTRKASSKKPVKTKKTRLNPQQELFCQYFTRNDSLRGHGTLSYAEAYKFKLDEMSDDDAVYEQKEDGTRGKKIESSTYDKAYQVCSTQGSRLLRNVHIQKRLTELFNELLRDDVVDGELSKVILQNEDLSPKMKAISEYNKLKGRITEKTDITSAGKKIESFNETQLERIARRISHGRAPSKA